MSKGSKQRPTDKAKFDEAWDRIFAVPKKWATREELKEMYPMADEKGEQDEPNPTNRTN